MGYGLEIVSHVVFYVVNTIQTSRYNVVVMMCMCKFMDMRMLKYVLPSKQLPWGPFPVGVMKFVAQLALLHFTAFYSQNTLFSTFFLISTKSTL